MSKTRKVNLWLVLLMTLIAVLSCFFGVFALKDSKKTISASAATEIDVTDSITFTQDDWMSGNPTDCITLSIRINNTVSGGYLYEYVVANSSIQGYWNDNGAKFVATNGVDIMDYLYFNGESARSIVTKNQNGTTSYTGTTFPLSAGGVYSPIAIETTGSFTTLKILNTWIPQDGFTLTVKNGFELLLNDGKIITTTNDVSFKYLNGSITKIIEKETTDVTNAITFTQDDWMSGSPTDCITLSIRINNTVSGGYLYEYVVANSSIQGYWNDNGTKYATTNSVDIMDYLYFNGESARSIVTKNQNGTTSYTGTTFPLSNGGIYSPIAVETAGSWTSIKILKAWIPQDGFTLTVKNGFELLLNDGKIITTTGDVSFKYLNGSITKLQTYTLSFSSEAGTVDPITVTNGSAIGELPAVPEKSGYTGVWQIDGVAINASTVYNYGANKTATAVYTENLVKTDVTEQVAFTVNGAGDVQSILQLNLAPNSVLKDGYWNLYGADLTSKNNGVDIMQYVYVNNRPVRELSNENASSNKYQGASGTWAGNGYECAPVFVETSSSCIYITVVHAYSTTNYTITLKAGFELLRSDGSIATISEDVNFIYNAGTITKVQQYTLSFEGLDDTVQVFTNQAIGALPDLPEVEDEVVIGWAINGALISGDTLWTYSENKTAQPLYAQKYTLSFDGLEDTLTVVDNEKIGELPEIPVKEGCEGVWAINGTEITADTVWTYGESKTAVAAYKKDITKTFTLGDYSDDGDLCFVATDINTDSTVSGTWHNTTLVSANGGVDIMEYVYVKGSSARALSTENTSSNTYVGTESWLANGHECCPVFIETTADSGLWIRIVDDFAGNFFEITFKAGFRLIDTEGTVVYLSENVTYKYINDNGTVTFTKGTITAEDLDRLNGQDITLMNGAEVYAEKKTGGWTLPGLDPISDENNDNETLDQVFVGWTTAATFVAGTSDLYPAGHLFVPTGTTTLYAVWIGFELEDGAGVRLTSDSSGYRFKARINSTHYNTTYSAIISDIGMIVTPTNYLEYVDFTHVALGTGNYAEVSKATLGEDWRWMQGGEGSADAMWIYAAAFTGIPENMYSRMNSARGYLKINYTSGAGYIYTPYNEENNARSIYAVATLAYDDYNGHATLKNYVNKVADITWTLDSFAQTVGTKGNWAITDITADGATVTVAVAGDFASVLINGKRLIEGYSTNVALGNYIYKFSDLAFTETGFTFVLGAADDTVGKVNDETLYFYSSDSDLDFFLNDFFKRHSGYTEDGVNLKVNSVTAGVNSEEFFSHEWMSKAYYWYNSDDGYAEDRIAGLRTFLSSVPVDDYGYVWSSNDKVRPNDATPSSAEQRMGWPYPSNDDIKGISWDFNGSTGSWSNNISATSSNNLYTAYVSGQTADIVFTSPTASTSGFRLGIFNYRKIYTYSAPLLEFDIRIDDVTNVNDILVGYTTSAQSTTQWVSVKENAFMSYDIGNATGAYNHLIFMPMYAFWGASNSTYLKQIQIKIDIKDGKAMSGNVGLNYVRPTIDTRMTNNNSILISSLRQDYDFTGDLTYLQNNITRARKAMNFLMQMYDSSRKLNKQSYLVGHDGDQGDIESSLGNGYWDILFMPEYDFQSNMYFYKAVADMAYLEDILTANSITVDTSLATIKTATRSGATSTSAYSYTADSLTTVANNVLGAMQATTANGGFWNESTGRFAAGYNSSGTLYDYGYVAWNLEAIYYGIATETQATSIMTWLNSETELYDYKFAPISITETGDKKVLNGQYYNNSSIKSNWVNCQYGGAILYTSFYDLMARIDYSGTDDAYARLQEIQAWYMEVYNNYMQEIGANPNEFYRYYYEEKGIVVQGQGINGAVGLDAEFLESYLPLSAVAYGFFGIDSIDGKTLKIAPELPTELNYWGMENLAFNFVEYDLKAYKNGVQITSVRGDTTDLSMRIVLNYVAGQKVYVNGVETSNYTVENGKVCVTVDFGATIVEVK